MSKLYGIDLDGVCFDFITPFSAWIEEHLGIPMPPNTEITSYYWHECVDGLKADDFWDEFHKFGQAVGYKNLDLLPGALDGLRAISDAGHRIMYITNRPKYALDDTLSALSMHNFPYKTCLKFANGAKAPIMREFNVDVFLDDSPHTIPEICAGTNAKIYCMDSSYNRSLHDLNNYTRVCSWENFLEEEGLNVKSR